MRLELRPSIVNPDHWYPDRSDRSAWKKVRQAVLAQWDNTCQFCGHRAWKHMHVHHLYLKRKKRPALIPVCVACHAVLHLGLNLMYGAVEVWKSNISQQEIVRRTRQGILEGKSLSQIKKTLPISSGPLPPHSVEWANGLVAKIGRRPTISLRRPYCAVFVSLKKWQLEDSWAYLFRPRGLGRPPGERIDVPPNDPVETSRSIREAGTLLC